MQLMRLDEETWGERLRRARERQSRRPDGLTMSDAASRVSEFWGASAMSLARLEREKEIPRDPKRRLCAYLAILSYGFDPADWGLYPEDLPQWVDRRRLERVVASWISESRRRSSGRARKSGTRKSPSIRWYYGTGSEEAA